MAAFRKTSLQTAFCNGASAAGIWLIGDFVFRFNFVFLNFITLTFLFDKIKGRAKYDWVDFVEIYRPNPSRFKRCCYYFSVTCSVYAFIKIPPNVRLVTFKSGLSTINRAASWEKLVLKLAKKYLSHGWIACEVCGGKRKRWMSLSLQSLLVNIF